MKIFLVGRTGHVRLPLGHVSMSASMHCLEYTSRCTPPLFQALKSIDFAWKFSRRQGITFPTEHAPQISSIHFFFAFAFPRQVGGQRGEGSAQ